MAKPDSEPAAFVNGEFVSESLATVPVHDAGFVQGVTVAEQLRTFGGQLFRLDDHLARLERSLAIVGVEPGLSLEAIRSAAIELARRNHALLAPDDDLNLVMFVTPGAYPAMAPAGKYGPNLVLHTYPLPFLAWAEKYTTGESLVTTDVLQTPERCWPAELKCRSRMHYYLADKAARAIEPGARAVMLDSEGHVTEATTANLVVYDRSRGVSTPPRQKILPGISLATLETLARELALPWSEQDLVPDDLAGADEVWLSSTSPCLLPVTRFNGVSIGGGRPGPVFEKLISAWSRLAGLDIVGQAERWAEGR